MDRTEIERVRDAYAQRRPGGRYDPRRGDVVDRAALRSRTWGAELLRAGRDLGVVVEVGCGTGSVLRWAEEIGCTAAIGIDAIADRLDQAAASRPGAPLLLADGQRLPVATSSVDTVLLSTLLSSVLDDAVALAIASEVRRVLRPGGVALWFDLRRDNPGNRDVRPVNRSDVERFFPGCEVRLRSVVLAPPLAARLLRWPRLASALECIPVLRTHLAGSIRKP